MLKAQERSFEVYPGKIFYNSFFKLFLNCTCAFADILALSVIFNTNIMCKQRVNIKVNKTEKHGKTNKSLYCFIFPV